MGTQDICLAVGRTEGADYSRWGSQPPPLTTLDMGRPAHFTRQSYLSTHRHMAARFWTNGRSCGRELAVWTSIKGSFNQSSGFLLPLNLV